MRVALFHYQVMADLLELLSVPELILLRKDAMLSEERRGILHRQTDSEALRVLRLLTALVFEDLDLASSDGSL